MWKHERWKPWIRDSSCLREYSDRRSFHWNKGVHLLSLNNIEKSIAYEVPWGKGEKTLRSERDMKLITLKAIIPGDRNSVPFA